MTKSQATTILQVAVPSPLHHLFDYLPTQGGMVADLQPGMRVVVPFGTRKVVGIIMHVATQSHISNKKLKPILNVLDAVPLLSPVILQLITWTSDYYHHPIGDLVNNVLPKLLRIQKVSRKKRVQKLKEEQVPQSIEKANIKLNAQQKNAVITIKKHLHEFKTFLLDGVTGSGKTEVYLQIIKDVIAQKKQALVLIPEINLTPQTIARFTARFGAKIAVLHSRLTPHERLRSWLDAKNGVAPIVIGTRSAIFTPLQAAGIIIVDEEHDLSFKQQSGLRYSARDLAVMRGNLENIPVVLGSATPSFESIANVKRKRYIGLTLPERAGGATCPQVHLVDMRSQKLKNGIAENLLHKITTHLARGGQVLIFLNRRGFAPILLCHHCGWLAGCEHCDAKLTLHQKTRHLRCHHCGITVPIPVVCPACKKENLLMLGFGTERVAAALQELFPAVKLVRVDSDTTQRKHSLENLLKKIHADECQILVGTQMLAKGHHFPKVTMAAILNVDQSLFGSDFRAGEHLAQLIVQVAGRAGREQLPGEVYIQTHHPQHPLLLSLINGGYMSFVHDCLAERQSASLPPYAYLALLQAESKQQVTVQRFLTTIYNKVHNACGRLVRISSPVAANMERRAGYFRMQMLLQSEHRDKLHKALEILLSIIAEIKLQRSIKWYVDVDPVEL